ncbi:Origin recognition complex subunit 5 [Yarrowia sp. C11]|nr:Origin recognition complex subunit 5 [Yarrowia sp. E02]KAG5371661.1 Origin recognition complex subunit 5 [Yarrowia sp. C11]
MLPKHVVEATKDEVACRDTQIKLLSVLLSENAQEMPQSILVHGEPSTGKSTVLKHLLKQSFINHSIVLAEQCLTTRILLQRTFRAVVDDSHKTLNDDFEIICENVTQFMALLERFRTEYGFDKPHVIVLDGLDKLHENPSEIYHCFTRLSEMTNIRNVCFIFTISTLEPRALITSSIPHVRFTRYTKDEVVKILSAQQLCKLPEEILQKAAKDQTMEEQRVLSAQFWSSYCQVLVDALSPYASSDVRLYKQIARRIWPVYVDPVITGTTDMRETAKLYIQSQHIFSSEFAVADSLVQPGVEEALKRKRNNEADLTASYDLPLHSKYILVAAYLASYNPERYDIRFFSKQKDGRKGRRDTGRRKRLTLNPRMLEAPPFELERMLAILHSISPEEQFGTAAGVQSMSNIDLPGQIATLTTLKLLVRTSGDPLDSRTKWKVNAGWGLIERLAKDIELPIQNYLLDENE